MNMDMDVKQTLVLCLMDLACLAANGEFLGMDVGKPWCFDLV